MAASSSGSSLHARQVELRPNLAALSGKSQVLPAVRYRMHSASEWEAMYPIIKRLYITERRKLSDVMAFLERKHGFKATEQMYKKRFAAWSLSKTRRRHAASGGDTSEKQGPVVPLEDTPDWELAPVSTCRMQKLDLQPGEAAIYCIANWTNGSFDSVAWLWGSLRAPGEDPAKPVLPSTRVYQDFALSHALLARGQGALAGMAVRKAFWHMEEALMAGDPALLRNLVDILPQMLQRNQTQLVQTYMTHLSRLTARKLPALHPLAKFFNELARDDVQTLEVVRRAWQCYVEKIHHRMNEHHYWLYDQWAWETSFINMDTDPTDSYMRITEALQALALMTETVEAKPGPISHLELLKNTHMIKNNGIFRTSTLAVLEAMKENEEFPEVELPAGRLMRSHVDDYLQVASINRAIQQRKWNLAQGIMQSNLQNSEAIHGAASREAIGELWSLEKVVRMAGDEQKADLIAHDALCRVREYLAEVSSYVQ
ncbi:Clr5 domain-containing protein [Xylariales sp. PMI_506]|nr:Clr5 domain-containing protein [Xylariales sp. PMI_506]